MKQQLALILLAMLMTFSISVSGFERYVPGVHYSVSQNIEAPTHAGKVKVYEFFSYGCPHCASIAPILATFHKALPDYVEWERHPAMWSKPFLFYAGVYQALKELGMETKYHERIFDAIHVRKGMAQSKESVLKWFAAQGEDVTALAARLEDPEALAKPLALTHVVYQKFNVSEVPAFIVDGRYVTSMGFAQDKMELMKILEFLIEKAARERKDVKSAAHSVK